MTAYKNDTSGRVVCAAEIGGIESKIGFGEAARDCMRTYGADLCGFGDVNLLCSEGYRFSGDTWLGGFTGSTTLGFRGVTDACSAPPETIDTTDSQLNFGLCCQSFVLPR
jgi:hypothetical protein